MLERIFESLLGCKEIQSVHPKGNQSWIFIGRTGAEAETPILLPPDAKNLLILIDPDARKGWRWKRGWQRLRWWLASRTWWTWVWISFRSWSWTGRPGVLQSLGLQRIGHDWETKVNLTELTHYNIFVLKLFTFDYFVVSFSLPITFNLPIQVCLFLPPKNIIIAT